MNFKRTTKTEKLSLLEFQDALGAEPHFHGGSIELYVGLFEQAMYEHELAEEDEQSCDFCRSPSWGSWRLGLDKPLSLDYVPCFYKIELDAISTPKRLAHVVALLTEKIWFRVDQSDKGYYASLPDGNADCALNFFLGVAALDRSGLLHGEAITSLRFKEKTSLRDNEEGGALCNIVKPIRIQ